MIYWFYIFLHTAILLSSQRTLFLQVLCVLLLQNAGLKSKDIGARSMTIDLLGTVAARLKQDALLCRKETFWIVRQLTSEDDVNHLHPKDACSVCLDPRNEKPLVVCQGCQRFFHLDCMGVRELETPTRGWHCQFCVCKKQLIMLQSYCKSQGKDDSVKDRSFSDSPTKMEIIQQMLLNYLQDAGSADEVHLFTRWYEIKLTSIASWILGLWEIL